MGVALLACFLSGLLSIGVGVIAWRLGIRQRPATVGRTLKLLMIMGLSFLAFVVPIFQLTWWSTIRQGTDVPVDQFSAIGPALPSVVTRVTYYSNYAGTAALFRIGESDFVAWARSNKWGVKEIGSSPETVDLSDVGVERTVADGLVVSEVYDPTGRGVHIVYDRRAGECLFRFAAY